MNPGRTSTVCFVAVILFGCGLIAMGVLVVPIRPHFQLDAVLSPAQLADPAVRAATLALLQRASGNEWLLWALAGVALCTIGSIGLRAVTDGKWRENRLRR